MKDFEYYRTNPVPYRNSSYFTTYFVYSKGKVIFEGNYEQYKGNVPFPERALTEKIVDEEKLAKHQQDYRKEEHRLYNEFKSDLFEEFGVENNPKREKAFSLAWEYGRSSGYEEVYGYFDELVELIKD